MRIWFSGPRFFGIRPGISLGPEDLREWKQRPAAAALEDPASPNGAPAVSEPIVPFLNNAIGGTFLALVAIAIGIVVFGFMAR